MSENSQPVVSKKSAALIEEELQILTTIAEDFLLGDNAFSYRAHYTINEKHYIALRGIGIYVQDGQLYGQGFSWDELLEAGKFVDSILSRPSV